MKVSISLIFILYLSGFCNSQLLPVNLNLNSNTRLSINLDLEGEWSTYKRVFNKFYLLRNIETRRRVNFMMNFMAVEEHNRLYASGLVTYRISINPFSDMSRQEFVSWYCGTKPEDDDEARVKRQTVSSVTSVPNQWDIRVNGPGQLTPVKDQLQCGSCWAFSVTSAIENVISFKTGQTPVHLAEQQKVDCVYSRDGCQGGWFTTAYDYVKNVGLTTNVNYPYKGVYGRCRAANFAGKTKILGFTRLADDVTTIKNRIMTKGACAVCVDASYWHLYQSGVYSDSRVSNGCNHGVVLVGWGTDTATKMDYWLILNSWGASWGEQGYIRVATNGTGGIRTDYVYCPDV
uniref:CSON015387 protein n=1 Tax=Culicoides sonorensis TaxID=179676 RepID=A0A336KUW1_CULSO